jgi:hypothetical protein
MSMTNAVDTIIQAVSPLSAEGASGAAAGAAAPGEAAVSPAQARAHGAHRRVRAARKSMSLLKRTSYIGACSEARATTGRGKDTE